MSIPAPDKDPTTNPAQIAAWTGHKTLAEVEHYTREYDRMKAVMG